MRIRLAGLLAGIAVVSAALIAGSTPATAAPAKAGVVHPMASGHPVRNSFYNNGYYWAYADVWAYDEYGAQIGHDYSGSLGHTGQKWLVVPAGTAKLTWKVRREPWPQRAPRACRGATRARGGGRPSRPARRASARQ